MGSILVMRGFVGFFLGFAGGWGGMGREILLGLGGLGKFFHFSLSPLAILP
jgi:hypothetical protein